MLRFVFVVALGLLLSAGAQAKPTHHAHSYSRSAGEADLATHGTYTNVSGHHVHRPSKTRSGHVPAGASAKCGDGSYSFSEHHRGTCSHHGGVLSWL